MRDLSSLSPRAPNYQAKGRGAARGTRQTPLPAPALAEPIDRSPLATGSLLPRAEAGVGRKSSFSHPTRSQRELSRARATLEKMGASPGPFLQKAGWLGEP